MKKFLKFLKYRNEKFLLKPKTEYRRQEGQNVEEYDYLFKIACVGDENSGKTTTIIQSSHGFSQELYTASGVEFSVKTIEIYNGKEVKLRILNTNSQERFQYVRPTYYRGAMGFVIFFNIAIRESFEHVPKWIEEIRSYLGDFPILIVGNLIKKQDERVVDRAEAEVLAREYQVYYIESGVYDLNAIENIYSTISCMMIGIDVPNHYLSYRHNLIPINRDESEQYHEKAKELLRKSREKEEQKKKEQE